jgi:hypothetical protein
MLLLRADWLASDIDDQVLISDFRAASLLFDLTAR